MKAIPIFCIAMIFFLITNCNNSKTIDQSTENQSSINTKKLENSKETICIFANAEIEKYIRGTKKKDEFINSEYLKTIIVLNENLKSNCDFKHVIDNFLVYLNSTSFKKDAQKITLEKMFLVNKNKLIKDAENETNALKELVKTIAEITYHKENARMGLYSRSAIQRLSNVNKDTIELRRNVSYRFPTEFFIHENLSGITGLKYDDSIIKGGNTINSIKEQKIKAKNSNGVFDFTNDLTIYVKTIN